LARSPVVPRSFVEPVPAAQARSRVQEIVDADRAEVERALITRSKQELLILLFRAEAELAADVRRLEGPEGKERTWTQHDADASLAQMRLVLGRVEPRFVKVLQKQGLMAYGLGVKAAIDVLAHYEQASGGVLRPLALRPALALEQTLMSRYPSSVARYGAHAVEVFRRELQTGVLAGRTFSEMTKRLETKGGDPGALVQSAGWAARIVRTEAMHAYATGTDQEIHAQRLRRFPDLCRKLIETFDSRTAADSRVAHGEVRGPDDPFVDGAGRIYMIPPGRPNDRAVIIPWRRAWEEPESTAPGPVVPRPVVVRPVAIIPPPAPPAPPAPPPPTPSIVVRPAELPATTMARAFLAANGSRSPGNQARQRTAVRAMLEGEGITSVDVAASRPDAGKMHIFPGRGSLRGTHDWRGKIKIQRQVFDEAIAGMRALDAGHTLTNPQINGLRTLTHEELHGASRIQPGGYRAHGVGIEEALTELSARRLLASRLGLLPDTLPHDHPLSGPFVDPITGEFRHGRPGSYDHFIERLAEHVATVSIPTTAPRSEILARRALIPLQLEAAVKVLRGPSTPPSASIATPNEHAQALGRALGFSPAQVDTFVAILQSDPRMMQARRRRRR
jgi:hypothetical protein